VNKHLSDGQKLRIFDRVKKLFSEVMDTGTDHIGITIREYGVNNLTIGRVKDQADGVALINADIRLGRTIDQRRELALGFMQIMKDILGIPDDNLYVTFTEHKGEDFHLNERYLAGWTEGEDPLS